jgi:hypothetical protein
MIRALAARWLHWRCEGALTRWLQRIAAAERTTARQGWGYARGTPRGYVAIDELEDVEWVD